MPTKLTTTQRRTLVEILAASFVDDPLVQHIFPDVASRRPRLCHFFKPIIRYCELYGQVEVTSDGQGAVLWVSHRVYPPNFWRIVRSGLIWMPFGIGQAEFNRLEAIDLVAGQAMVKRCAGKAYAYLWVLGVNPPYQRRGYARQVVEAALQKMAADHEVCVLQTENPNNVPIYERLGFQAVHSDTVVAGKIRYWIFEQTL